MWFIGITTFLVLLNIVLLGLLFRAHSNLKKQMI